MAKIALFFGSNQGNTESVGRRIAELINADTPGTVEVFNIGNSSPQDLLKWDKMIMGISTWDFGQLQDDWALFIPRMEGLNLSGKTVAVFGLGDQYGYSSNYVDSVGVLAETVSYLGAKLVGAWPNTGYQFESSLADRGDHFIGLACDQDNESGKTEERCRAWVKQLKAEMGW